METSKVRCQSCGAASQNYAVGERCKNCGAYHMPAASAPVSQAAGELGKICREKNDRNLGLFRKYHVQKLTNPTKQLDCIVLEFDDPHAREGIRAFAESVKRAGYTPLHHDLMEKLAQWEAR